MSSHKFRNLSAVAIAALILGFAGTSSAKADDRYGGGQSRYSHSYSSHGGGYQGFRSPRMYSQNFCAPQRYVPEYRSPRQYRTDYSFGFNRGNRHDRRGCD